MLDLSMTMPYRTIPEPAGAYRVLASLPPGPVAEFPFFYRRVDFHLHARYMFNSIYHWHPLINGYSDFIPPDFDEIATPLASFPNPEGFRILRARRARYAVVHLGRYGSDQRLALVKRLQEHSEYLRPRLTEGDAWLYEIVAWPPSAAEVSPLLFPGER
jgi:hypothetical protein